MLVQVLASHHLQNIMIHQKKVKSRMTQSKLKVISLGTAKLVEMKSKEEQNNRMARAVARSRPYRIQARERQQKRPK